MLIRKQISIAKGSLRLVHAVFDQHVGKAHKRVAAEHDPVPIILVLNSSQLLIKAAAGVDYIFMYQQRTAVKTDLLQRMELHHLFGGKNTADLALRAENLSTALIDSHCCTANNTGRIIQRQCRIDLFFGFIGQKNIIMAQPRKPLAPHLRNTKVERT